MRDEIILPSRKLFLEGRVILDYTDGITGRVKNRVEGKNTVFEGTFIRGNAFILSGAEDTYSPFGIKISNKNADFDANIPVVQGRLIGYGEPGSSASGTMQGAENISARSLGIYSEGKYHVKRQWSWLPSQIEEEIGSFGIGLSTIDKYAVSSFDPLIAAAIMPACPEYCDARHGKLGTMGVVNMKNMLSYSNNGQAYISDASGLSGSIVKTDLKTWVSETIQMKGFVPVPSDIATSGRTYYGESYANMLLAIDVDNNDVCILCTYRDVNSVCSVQEIRFNAAMSVVKSNTVYKCGTYDFNSDTYTFSGYDGSDTNMNAFCKNGCYYFPFQSAAGSEYSRDCKLDTSLWSASGSFSDAFVFRQAVCDYLGNVATSSKSVPCLVVTDYAVSFCTRVMDISGGIKDYKHIGYLIYSLTNLKQQWFDNKYMSGSWYIDIPIVTNILGKKVLASHRFCSNTSASNTMIDGNYNLWLNVGDFTLYKMPADAPVRLDGQGVTITYEIAWGYE